MKRFAIQTLALLALLCGPCFAGQADDNEVPFSFEKGFVVAHATIKGDRPVDVLLSTGAEHSSIDTSLLSKYKLSAYYTSEGIVTGHNDKTVSFTTVSDVRLGSIKAASMNMRLGSLAEVSKRLGREIFGILGTDFFKGRAVQFDFAKKTLRFLPQSEADALKDAKAGRVVLRMVSYTNLITMPVAEQVTYDGKAIKTLFDTGTVTVVALSFNSARQVGLKPPEKGTPLQGKVNSLRLDDYEMAAVPVALYPKGSDFDRDMKEFGAVAGTILLQNFVVTFDFGNKLIILEHV